MTSLAVLLLQAAPRDPFFTNDIAGVLKFVGILATVVLAPLGTVVYRLVFNKTNEKVDALEAQLNGFGKRVDEYHASVTACDAKHGTLNGQVIRMEGGVQRIAEAQSALEANVGALRSQGVEMQRDIMAAITESAARTQGAVHMVELQVTRLEERSKLAEALTEITAALREGRATGR